MMVHDSDKKRVMEILGYAIRLNMRQLLFIFNQDAHDSPDDCTYWKAIGGIYDICLQSEKEDQVKLIDSSIQKWEVEIAPKRHNILILQDA